MSLNQNLQNYLNTNNSTLDKYIISTFYKFLVLENYKELKIKFDKSLSKTNIKGTILLANEGVNGTIAGSESDLKKFFLYMDKQIDLVIAYYNEVRNLFLITLYK